MFPTTLPSSYRLIRVILQVYKKDLHKFPSIHDPGHPIFFIINKCQCVNRHSLSMADNLTEVRANGVLGLWCQAGKELVGIQACVLDQLLCCANNRACNITLEGLSLKG